MWVFDDVSDDGSEENRTWWIFDGYFRGHISISSNVEKEKKGIFFFIHKRSVLNMNE